MSEVELLPDWDPNLSPAEYLASLPRDLRGDLLSQYSQAQQASLRYDWRFWARPKQLPPPGSWLVWLIMAGRGFGKTRAGAEFVRDQVVKGKAKRIALVAKTPADARDTMIEDFPQGPKSGLLAVGPPSQRPEYEPSKRRLVWPEYGATATIYSGAEPDKLRGPGHDLAWVDELPAFRYPKETWDNLMFGLRLGANPRALVTTTPRPIPLMWKLIDSPTTKVTAGTTYENRANLAETFYRHVLESYEGTRLGKQEIWGQLLKEVEGALWKHVLLDENRVSSPPPGLSAIIVAVDPQGSVKTSTETGIVAVGLAKGRPSKAYVLEDRSISASPGVWGKRVVDLYEELGANYVIAEVNNGGDMVSHVIHTVNESIPVQQVSASRGKLTRAEPVAALYEKRRVYHVGSFPELEDQMCTWLPGETSPDRMDALVWGVSALLVGRLANRGYTWGRN